jgi:hypothetical protein
LAEKVSINEKALLYRLQCPLRWIGESTVPESPVLSCAESTARWLIAERFHGRAPSLHATHAFFEIEWNQTAYFRSRNAVPPKEYGRRLTEIGRACRRLRDIIWRCQILQPVTGYTLPVGNAVITGEFAVLRSSRRKKHAFALYLRHEGVRIKRLVPDVVSFARRLELGNRWTEPANRHWGIESIGVMHYWVERDLAAEHKIGLSFASDVLLGAVSSFTGNPFPLPGEHCLACPTRACRPDDLICPPVSSIPGVRGN